MKKVKEYLEAIKLKIVTSPIVSNYEIVKERTTNIDGYIKVRMTLINGDYLEVSEYFESTFSNIKTIDYRYQWMDKTKNLLCRWDNAPHHKELDNFPHHIHKNSEYNVIPGNALSISQVLDIIKTLLLN